MSRKAIILFNLGGPDKLDSVKPFLFNLFNDKYIIDLPKIFRWLLAKFISSRREEEAKHIYSQIGGKSPILENTNDQAKKLEEKLGEGSKVFVAMRYWHPMIDQVINDVIDYDPEEIILLPLYPQFSTTTTKTAIEEWNKFAKNKFTKAKITSVCCYNIENNFINSHVELIKNNIDNSDIKTKILFSAHGLPQKIVDNGDPYQYQIEKTTEAIMQKIDDKIDHVICYQSKVGPLKWLEPSTDTEIKNAIKDGYRIIIVPIAFISEHSETLVELDMQYKEMAQELGCVSYIRIPAVGINDNFINSLSNICSNVNYDLEYNCFGSRCLSKFVQCPLNK
jgi:protoporphyrin/coproporphyrin ferrochelatase